MKREGAIGGRAVTDERPSGTSGGHAGTNGAARKLAFVMAAGFVTVLVMITIGNAESMMSDFAAAGVRETKAHVWIWQVTSVLAWLSVTPAIWWAVARVRPPRFAWAMVALIGLAGLPLASVWHIAAMIALRKLAYLATGETYHFQGGLARPYLYEFRKDIATYLQFVGLAALCQWLLARVAEPARIVEVRAEASPRFLEVPDGAVTHRVPLDEIDTVTAAGNYVELGWRDRTLMHRATLAGVEAELGGTFARIHRSRLVRRAAIRAVELNQAGDFEVVLASGERVKGSRRYRGGLEESFGAGQRLDA